MSDRSVVRPSDAIAIRRLGRQIAAAPRRTGGAVLLRVAARLETVAPLTLAAALADGLRPRPADMEVRAVRRIEGKAAAVDLARHLEPGGHLGRRGARALLAASATLVIQKADAQSPGWDRLARAFEAETAQPCQVNLYAGPPETPGLPWHRDPHDVLMLVLTGEKILDVAARLGPRGPESAERVVLRAGDALWLPRGTPHQAANGPSGAVHAAIGLLHLVEDGNALVRARDADSPSLSPGAWHLLPPALAVVTRAALDSWRPGRAQAPAPPGDLSELVVRALKEDIHAPA
ncbi:JmjC domain-containing protein [Futiania mangrovi]|uniref:Ribosomal oxygenase 2 n=1 Tax=Futiania mangrovi TaxID=2959716 RepID=A0A9J6PC22_9PROT|nr:cupin domain-containing protein [Futiania mangrovii]MCP1337740.1 cupin domain-containing protein [Futiania mangrovii]